MNRKIIIVISVIIIFIILFFGFGKTESQETRQAWWDFQSIDTMKYSRDVARQKLSDSTFDSVIDRQVRDISQVGATHVAIATPYDEEFYPFLKKWVDAARKHGLKVWFRGNWAGWERWFGYARIDRAEHIRKTEEFILKHTDIFRDGDVFTGCPECENGGPGDPRRTRDVVAHRRFLIEEYEMTKEAFEKIGKKVQSNFFSMNGDVARLVMDKDTTEELDGVVVIDHYVSTPTQLVNDVRELAKQSGGKIVLGEFGAPIPNLHGNLSEEGQAQWIANALQELVVVDELLGINYWVNIGGSTQLWRADGKERKAVGVLSSYYNPQILTGTLENELGEKVAHAHIVGLERSVRSDRYGNFKLPYVAKDQEVSISSPGYFPQKIKIGESGNNVRITLVKKQENIVFKVKKLIKYLLNLP